MTLFSSNSGDDRFVQIGMLMGNEILFVECKCSVLGIVPRIDLNYRIRPREMEQSSIVAFFALVESRSDS